MHRIDWDFNLEPPTPEEDYEEEERVGYEMPEDYLPMRIRHSELKPYVRREICRGNNTNK